MWPRAMGLKKSITRLISESLPKYCPQMPIFFNAGNILIYVIEGMSLILKDANNPTVFVGTAPIPDNNESVNLDPNGNQTFL